MHEHIFIILYKRWIYIAVFPRLSVYVIDGAFNIGDHIAVYKPEECCAHICCHT